VGRGTSGRLGVLDASEVPPTFGVEPELVTGIIAGGDHALRMSIEGAEDASLGLRDLAEHVTAGDVVVGISASGRAPYVVDAIEGAKRDLDAAATIAITCTPGSALARAADVALVVEVGREVIVRAQREGIVTSTTLMTNAPGTTHAAALAATRPGLDIGVHLVLTYAKPLLNPSRIRSLVREDGSFWRPTELLARSIDRREALM